MSVIHFGCCIGAKVNKFEPLRENYKDEEVSYSLQYGAAAKGKSTNFETDKSVVLLLSKEQLPLKFQKKELVAIKRNTHLKAVL